MYVLITVIFFTIMQLDAQYVPQLWLRLLINTGCIVLFIAHTIHYDFPLKNLPIIGKYFRK